MQQKETPQTVRRAVYSSATAEVLLCVCVLVAESLLPVELKKDEVNVCCRPAL